MAIFHDADAVSTDQTASPLTWNHTVNPSGTNNLLVVGVFVSSGTPQPTTTAVTYGGVSMVKARADQVTASTALVETSVWLLFNPPTGSNQVSVTVSSSGSTPHFGGASSSYQGVQQSNVADAVGGKTGNATGDQTFTVTTSANNAWIFVMGANVAGTAPTLTADQTSRQTLTLASIIASVIRTEDTNAAQTPAGAKTVGMTTGATALEDGFALTGVSFGPQLSISVRDQVQILEDIMPDYNGFATSYFAQSYFGGTYYQKTITLAEQPVTPTPNVSDSTTTSENVNIAIADQINISDSTTTSENVAVLITGINVSDSTTTFDGGADQNSGPINNLSGVFFGASSSILLAVSLQASHAAKLLSISVSLESFGAPTDAVIAYIYNDSSGSPGSAIATSNNTVAGSSLSTSSYTSESFTFNTPTLSANTPYWVVLGRTGAADGTNQYNANTVSTSTNSFDVYNGTSWGTHGGQPFWYQEYTTEVTVNIQVTPSVSDSTATSENVAVAIAAITINVSDSTATSENTIELVTSFVIVSDTTTTSESIGVAIADFAVVSDSTTTSEHINIAIVDQINVSDSTTTSENIVLNDIEIENVSDTTVTSENVNVTKVVQINVSDSTVTSESITLLMLSFVSVSDSTSTSESINLLVTNFINVSDSTTTSENVQITGRNSIAASDSITTSESLLLLDQEGIGVLDTIVTSEAAQLIILQLYIITSDSTTTSESINLLSSENIQVSDTTVISESVSVFAAQDLQIGASINLVVPAPLLFPLTVPASIGFTLIQPQVISLTYIVPSAITFIAIIPTSFVASVEVPTPIVINLIVPGPISFTIIGK